MAASSKLLALSLSLALPLSVLAYFWWRKRNRVVRYESVGHVSGLFIYPVKSCRGISLDSATCLTEGLRFDRRWIVMDKNEKIVSIGEKPSLGLVVPHFEDDKYLCLNAPGMNTLKLDLDSQADSKNIVDLRYLRISTKSQYAGDEAAEWFSTYLNCPGCKVYRVYEPRLCSDDPKWGDKALLGDKTGFAAFSAYLMTTESSLVVLNEKLPSPVGMDRFRPNIVIGGTDPFAEDQWKGKAIKIGDVKFRFLKECGRCIVTTVDPGTGKRTGYKLLSTLRKMRLFKDRDPRHGNDPLFGAQMAPDNEGIVKLGDPVSVAC